MYLKDTIDTIDIQILLVSLMIKILSAELFGYLRLHLHIIDNT